MYFYFKLKSKNDFFHKITLKIMFNEKNNPFKMTQKEELIEMIGILLFIGVFIGSAVKLLFL